jgi:hypothetical protein
LLTALATLGLVTGTLTVGSAVIASNSVQNAFEIEGDLQQGVFTGSSDPTVAGEDWVDGANTGANGVNVALQCTVGSCAPANVTDGSGVGFGELFRDGLKVDPDLTTFTGGDKENDSSTVTTGAGGNLVSQTPWHIVTGSVPPNKDDLFDITTNTAISGSDAELDLGMLRTNNNGSSHLDFELNRLAGAPCAADATKTCPQRTEGDLLIAFEISPGGISQRFFVWDLPGGTDGGGHGRGGVACVGPLSGQEHPCPWEEIAPPLSSGGIPNLRTAVNTNELPAQPWGNRLPSGDPTPVIPVGGWFEAALDLDQIGFGPSCPGFGSASAKSRASGSSVTSALTDLAGPFPVNLNTCGKITIIKDTDPNALQDFDYTTAVTTSGLALSPLTFKLDDDSGVTGADDTQLTTKVYNQVTPGSYTVTEGAVTGYNLTSLTCTTVGSATAAQDSGTGSNPYKANITIGNLGEATCTYVNSLQQGAIKLTKTNGKGGALAGAKFSITQGSPAVGISGSPFTTNASGEICVDHLSFGNYDVTETEAPTGYKIDDPATRTIAVNNNATCAEATYGGESSPFTDTPLSKFQVIFTSLAGAGVTRANIDCSVPEVAENGAPDSLSISGNTAASPTVVTTSTAHGLAVGAKVKISGSNSTPSINGVYTVTVLSTTTFSVPVNVTVAGTAGTVSPYDDTNETFGNTTSTLVPGSYTCTIDIDP